MLGSKLIDAALFPPRDPSALRGRLFRNDLRVTADGTRVLHFINVTAYERRQPCPRPWFEDFGR
jgi:hypothetical protein